MTQSNEQAPAPVGDGGPAFPCPWGCDRQGLHLPADPKGMSLRDYFAAHALAGYVAAHADPNVTIPGRVDAAQAAYEFADAMLAERGRGGAEGGAR